MKPFSGLLAHLHGQLADAGAQLADGVREWSARRLLDEQIHAVDEQLRVLRSELDVLKAQRFVTAERRDAAIARALQRESQAVAALAAGEGGLAREIAGSIVALEAERDAEAALIADNDLQRARLQTRLQHGENTLRRLRHELDLLRAAEAVARAEQVFAQGGSEAGIPTAIDSAERLRSRQAQPTPPADAGRTGRDALDVKIEAAGLAQAAAIDAVLARLAPLVRPARDARVSPPVRKRRTSAKEAT